MVKRAPPKGRKRPRKAEDAAAEDGGAGFFLLDDDDQQKQQQSEEEDEEQQETAEQKRIRLGERFIVSQGIRSICDDCRCSRVVSSAPVYKLVWQHQQQQPLLLLSRLAVYVLFVAVVLVCVSVPLCITVACQQQAAQVQKTVMVSPCIGRLPQS